MSKAADRSRSGSNSGYQLQKQYHYELLQALTSGELSVIRSRNKVINNNNNNNNNNNSNNNNNKDDNDDDDND